MQVQMTKDLISKRTRIELREHFVDNGTLHTIEESFDGAGIKCNLQHLSSVSGQRRTLIEQYYSTLDFSDSIDVRKFLNLCEDALVELENLIDGATYPDNSRQDITLSLGGLNVMASISKMDD